MREKSGSLGSPQWGLKILSLDFDRFWTSSFFFLMMTESKSVRNADGCMLRVYISIIRKNGDTLIARNRRNASTVGVKTHVPNRILVTFIDLDTLARGNVPQLYGFICGTRY